MKVKVHRVGHGKSYSIVIPKVIVKMMASYYGVDPENITHLELQYSNGVIFLTIPSGEPVRNIASRSAKIIVETIMKNLLRGKRKNAN